MWVSRSVSMWLRMAQSITYTIYTTVHTTKLTQVTHTTLTVPSDTTVLLELTPTQLPPPSLKVSASTPTFCCTTSKCPSESKAIPRGAVRFVATRWTENPAATEGAGTVVEAERVHVEVVVAVRTMVGKRRRTWWRRGMGAFGNILVGLE